MDVTGPPSPLPSPHITVNHIFLNPPVMYAIDRHKINKTMRKNVQK